MAVDAMAVDSIASEGDNVWAGLALVGVEIRHPERAKRVSSTRGSTSRPGRRQ
jgi:hypothetical protein